MTDQPLFTFRRAGHAIRSQLYAEPVTCRMPGCSHPPRVGSFCSEACRETYADLQAETEGDRDA